MTAHEVCVELANSFNKCPVDDVQSEDQNAYITACLLCDAGYLKTVDMYLVDSDGFLMEWDEYHLTNKAKELKTPELEPVRERIAEA